MNNENVKELLKEEIKTPPTADASNNSLVIEVPKNVPVSEAQNAKGGIFSKIDFGPLKPFVENDDVTDISYDNGGQIYVSFLSTGKSRVEIEGVNDALMEKLAFQCSNVMGKVFNMAYPFLDAEDEELRMNFVHSSVARNGIAVVIRKTPAKIRLKKENLLQDKYVTENVHDFLIKAIEGHCNVVVCGETGAGKTEFVKYLASHIRENEKIITIEDTLELHLDRIYPHRDIVAMKTNNIVSYTDVLVTCMRQNPKWILLSEVRHGEAVMAVRNSISSGHNIISTIHSDKASAIPLRMYSLLESNIDVEQFLATIHRYVHLGVYIRAKQDPESGKMVREITEVVEFYVSDEGKPETNSLYMKFPSGKVITNNPSEHLIEYLEAQGLNLRVNMNVDASTAVVEPVNQNIQTPTIPLEAQQVQNVVPTAGPKFIV